MERLPQEVRDLIGLNLAGKDLLAMSKMMSFSERVWRRACFLDFPRATYARQPLDETWHARFLALSSEAFPVVDMVLRTGFLEDAIVLRATLAMADLSARLLLNESYDCGVEYFLRRLVFVGVLRFCASQLLQLRMSEDANLEYGAMLISMVCDPGDVNVFSVCEEQIQGLAEDCRSRLQPSEGPTHAVKTVLERLAVNGIRAADSESYYDPRNSLLHFVLQPAVHGMGIPITLSIVVHAILRRAGVKEKLLLLNTTGHLLGRIEGTDTFVDCFLARLGSWEELSMDNMEDEQQNSVCKPRDVWVRVLTNLYFQEVQSRRFQRNGARELSQRLVALMGCLVSLHLEVLALDRFLENHADPILMHIRNEAAKAAGLSVMNVPERRAGVQLNLPNGRLKVGTMVLFGSNFERGIVVGGDGANLILCVEFDEDSERTVAAIDAVAVEGPHHPLNQCVRVGKYFLRFDLDSQKYIPNKNTLAEFPDDFA